MKEWESRYTAWMKENKGIIKTDPCTRGIKEGWHLPDCSLTGWETAQRVFIKPVEMKEDGVL